MGKRKITKNIQTQKNYGFNYFVLINIFHHFDLFLKLVNTVIDFDDTTMLKKSKQYYYYTKSNTAALIHNSKQ